MTQPNSTPPLDKALQGITLGASTTPGNKLHPELRSLIASRHQRLAGVVNALLTCLYWGVGQRQRTEVLGGADCAKYGTQILGMLDHQLSQEFGRGFESRNLRRMVKFAESFPDAAIVSTSSSPSDGLCCNRRTAYQARKQNIGSCSLTTIQYQQMTINRDAKKC